MDKILIGKGNQPVYLLAKYGNRHGLVAGTTGTGKTISLLVLLEGFSRLGVPVFMADVKGDVAGMAAAGIPKRTLICPARCRMISLEGKAIMGTKPVAFRSGFRTVTPYMLAPGPEFVDFLKRVFDAEETERTDTGPGRFHAEYKIGDSMLMVGAGSGRSMPMCLSVYVHNVDEVYQRALNAGCVELEAIRDDYGDRFGCVQDAAGNHWVIATHLGGNYIREGRNSVTVSFVTSGAARFIDFVKQAFTVQEIERYEWPNGFYASVKIGDSVVGVSEPTNHEWMRPMPAMIYMYVPDCDALYDQAIRAGAKSISPLADQSYGDRHGGVQDQWGNQWYIATPIR